MSAKIYQHNEETFILNKRWNLRESPWPAISVESALAIIDEQKMRTQIKIVTIQEIREGFFFLFIIFIIFNLLKKQNPKYKLVFVFYFLFIILFKFYFLSNFIIYYLYTLFNYVYYII